MSRAMIMDAWIHTWQIAAMIIVVWVASKWMADSRRPYVTYLMWLAVTIRCLIPFGAACPLSIFRWLPTQLSIVDGKLSGEPVRPGLKRQEGVVHRLSQPGQPPQTALSTEPDRELLIVKIIDSGDVSASRMPMWRNAVRAYPWPPQGYVILFSSWCLGCGLIFTLGVLKAWVITRHFGRKRQEPPASLLHLVKEISTRLHVKKPVTIWVTDNAGPAVFGSVRPKLILPKGMTSLNTPESRRSLEIVLTHELLHVRRHDLEVGLLQFATQVIWWFNPSVWWASRALTEAIERCCDQETIAHLGCQPVEYARCLLQIVEQQRSLPRIPALRSITPTGRRLTQIVQLSKECPMRKMPRSQWLCLFLVLVLFWPAEPMLNGQQEPPVTHDVAPIGGRNDRLESAVNTAADDAAPTPSTAEFRRTLELTEQQILTIGDHPDSAASLRPSDVPSRFREVALEECITSALHPIDFFRTAGAVERNETPEPIIIPPAGEIARQRLHHSICEVEFAYFNLSHRYCVLTTVKSARDVTLDLWREIASNSDQDTSEFEADVREQYFSFRNKVEKAKADVINTASYLHLLARIPGASEVVLQPVGESLVDERELDKDALRKMACANSIRIKELKAHHQRQKAALQKDLTELAHSVGQSDSNLAVSRNGENWKRIEQLRQSLIETEEKLAEIELEIHHQVSDAVGRMETAHANLKTAFQQRAAAREQASVCRKQFQEHAVSGDLLLDVHRRAAACELEHCQAVLDLQLSLSELNRITGHLPAWLAEFEAKR